MSFLPYICARSTLYVMAVLVLFCFLSPGRTDHKPLSKEEQSKVDKAIDKGVSYLKRVQRSSGAFPTTSGEGIARKYFPYAVGQSILPALALLECGVATDDPSTQKAASLLRKHASKLDSTYELSLAIMFLDRLGERQDEETIRTLALRLVAGQCYTGGWSYRCPLLKAGQEADLLKALRGLQKRLDAEKQLPHAGFKRIEGNEAPELPTSVAKLAVFQKPDNLFVREELEIRGRADRPVLLGTAPK